MKDKLFNRAVLKLTGWYMLMVLFVSLLCSTIFYQFASLELGKMAAPPGPGRQLVDDENWRVEREKRADDGRRNMMANLTLLNLSVLFLGGAFSYLLARRTLQPIAEAHESQGRFVSDAAHELRSPLAIMKSEAEVTLRDKSATKDDLRETIKSSIEEVDRLKQLTDRLLMLTVNQKLEIKEVDIEEVTKKSMAIVEKRARDKDIKNWLIRLLAR